MIKVRANIKFQKKEDGRISPIFSRYRPLFDFNVGLTSGQIELIEKDKLPAGEECEAKISFVNARYLGENFGPGTSFVFGEGRNSFGEGVVLEILMWDTE